MSYKTPNIDDVTSTASPPGSKPAALPPASAETPFEALTRQQGLILRQNVTAEHLTGVRAVIDGSLSVDKSIRGATLEVYEKVTAPQAEVTGGTLRVTGEMDVGTLGNDERVATRIELGVSPARLVSLLAQATEHHKHRQAQAHAMRQEYEQMAARSQSLSHSDRERMTELMFEVSSAETSVANFAKKITSLQTLIKHRQAVGLTVRQCIWPSVTLIIGEGKLTFQITRKTPGPLRIGLDREGRATITVNNDTSLLAQYPGVKAE